MRSTKFMWSGIIVLVGLLFASYLVPSFYFRGYAASKEGSSVSDNYGNSNNNSNSSNGNDFYNKKCHYPAVNEQFYSDSTTFNASYPGEFYYICQ